MNFETCTKLFDRVQATYPIIGSFGHTPFEEMPHNVRIVDGRHPVSEITFYSKETGKPLLDLRIIGGPSWDKIAKIVIDKLAQYPEYLSEHENEKIPRITTKQPPYPRSSNDPALGVQYINPIWPWS